MRILLDECVDWRLTREIVGHEVKTARQMGWSAIENGELLALTSQHFDVFVTVDRNLAKQQNLGAHAVAVVILQAKTNRLSDLKPLIPNLLIALRRAKPGVVEFVGGP